MKGRVESRECTYIPLNGCLATTEQQSGFHLKMCSMRGKSGLVT